MAFPTIQEVLNGATGADSGDWQSALLHAIGAPNTTSNRLALTYWHQSEGTNPNTHNWLAISDGQNLFPHAGGAIAQAGSSSPIYPFPSQAVGVAATAHFLQYPYYTNVVAAFQQNAGLGAIFSAINASPWCKGCQGGQYPIALAQAAQGNPPAVTDDGTAGSILPGSLGGTATPAGTYPTDLPGACLIGPFTMPSAIPDIPCLFYVSWGRAILGGVALVAGGITILIGATLAAGKSGALSSLPGLPAGASPMRVNR